MTRTYSGKQLCLSLFLNKGAGLRQTPVFSCEYRKKFENNCFEEHQQTVVSLTLLRAAIAGLLMFSVGRERLHWEQMG